MAWRPMNDPTATVAITLANIDTAVSFDRTNPSSAQPLFGMSNFRTAGSPTSQLGRPLKPECTISDDR